jgi:ABC-type transport system involved in multi-copper enzyme maturation permease subunit
MKYLAILKDSLLEALDTKVFYVMVGLSALVILIVASFSYRPITVEDEMERMARTLNWAIEMQGGNANAEKAPSFSVEDFKQTNPDGKAWERDYQFALVMHLHDPAAAQFIKNMQDRTARDIQFKMRERLSYLKEVRVTAGKPADPADIRFDVTTHGSTVTRELDWPHEPVVLNALPLSFWRWPVSTFVRFWEDILVGTFGAAIALLLSAVITAFFIPNMLRKGTVDLLVVKPIHRTTLLLYKYVGGLAFIFLNTSFVVVGIWLVLGLRTGMWGTGFLASILVITFQFALYYAVSTLFGVLTRSPIVAILMSGLAWVVFVGVIGYGYRMVDLTRKLPEIMAAKKDDPAKGDADRRRPPPDMTLPDAIYTLADILHFVTPRLNDFDALVGRLIAADTLPPESDEHKQEKKLNDGFSWSQAFTVTSIYIVVLLGISCWWFATKDY